MNFISLFTSFSGRINRAKWWLGMIVVMVVAMVGSFLVNPAAMEALTNPEAFATNIDALKPTLGQLIFGLIMAVLMLAIIFKRLNDRNWPAWVGMLIAVIYIGTQIAQYVMLQNVSSIAEMTTATLPISIISGVVFLFLLIDNGMLRGTVGPNPHGEDPIAHKDTDVT
jgi:uncharacterized membrane protein YhaH (DUF805 family)